MRGLVVSLLFWFWLNVTLCALSVQFDRPAGAVICGFSALYVMLADLKERKV